MNRISFKMESMTQGITMVEMHLTRKTEATFNEQVFPWLFDGKTTGARSVNTNGTIKYTLLVPDETKIKTLKQALFNAMLLDNGQMN